MPMFVVCLFIACRNDHQYPMLVAAIKDAAQVISGNTGSCLSEMTDRTLDPHKSEKANEILPQMMEVHFLAKKTVLIIQACIDKIETTGSHSAQDYRINRTVVNELFDSITKFKSELMNMDEGIVNLFKESKLTWGPSFPRDNDNFGGYYHSNFENMPAEKMLVYLYSLSLDIRLIEYKCMMYCLNTYNSSYCGYYKSSILIALNTERIRPSDVVEITAGMGSFETSMTRKIEIDGVEVPVTDFGIGVYRFKAEGKPGRKSKMVKIYYKDEYGDNQIISKRIEYEVRN